MAGAIDFYFDFISPFSYLAYQRLPGLAERYGHGIACHAINLAEAKLLGGNTGPTSREQPLKRRYNQKDKDRWARRYGVPIENPKSYGPDRINKGTFFADDRNATHAYIAYTWRKVWGEGGDMADEGLMADVAAQCGWNVAEFLGFTLSREADERYRAATLAAHRRGVFGVPTMFVGEEMWWGNDRLDFLEEFLRAKAAASAPAAS
ncbi:MAG TPA: 2-hydroxychromene-2-carboxylate isomerase [Stellaceae bacterium]|nr:2-hydroxychromene-2-carboxylate isomerase [Stellaceae bacterium]